MKGLRPRQAFIALAILLALITFPLYGWKVATKEGYSDFDTYYRAAQDVKASNWEGVYRFNPSGDTPYRYGPPSLILIRPFAAFSHGTARLLWYFLQVICFALGFHFLRRSVRRLGGDANLIVAISFLYVLRFCLDCFTIGQITSVMFLAWTIALDSWLAGRAAGAGAALYIPSVIKIGPALLYAQLASESPRKRLLSLSSAFLFFLVSCLAVLLLTLSWSDATYLWRAWLRVVSQDSAYFDAAHYGSQSIKSALLRLANAGFLTREAATSIFSCVAAVMTGALVVFWWRTSPRAHAPRGLHFSLGVFAYLWLMPETFKYSLPLLAIPIAMMLCHPMSRFEKLAFYLGVFTLSLAGMDVIGEPAFFWLQKNSVPALTLVLLGISVWVQAARLSRRPAV